MLCCILLFYVVCCIIVCSRIVLQGSSAEWWHGDTSHHPSLHYNPLPYTSLHFASHHFASVLAPIHPTMGWKHKINITALPLNGDGLSPSGTHTHRHQLLQQRPSSYFLDLSCYFFSSLHCSVLLCTALHCTALPCTTLLCFALCYTALLCLLCSLSGWIEWCNFLTIFFFDFSFSFSLLQYLSVCLLSNYILRGFYATARGLGGRVGVVGRREE